MQINFDKKRLENFIVPFAFLFFFAAGCYKLTAAGLWFDETIEFYYSKILSGVIPFPSSADGTTSMYGRIISTYQPPLYNFLMHFWLLLGEGERWFRLFGVIAGAFGAAGIFRSVESLSGSRTKAAAALMFYAVVPKQIYYIQEASEYCLLLAFLPWVIFHFIEFTEKSRPRSVLLFALFSILSVYSQYGAAFPVAAAGILIFVRAVQKKDARLVLSVAGIFALCVIVAVFPLWHFFIRIQLQNQIEKGAFWITSDYFSLKSLILSPVRIAQFLFLPSRNARDFVFPAVIIGITLAACAVFSVIDCVKTGDEKRRFFYISLYLTYVFFAAAVGLRVYSYGSFAPDRYKLFFLPAIFVLVFVSLDGILNRIRAFTGKNRDLILSGFAFCVFVFAATFSIGVFENCQKEDIRGAVEFWTNERLFEKPTYVYNSASGGFLYYVEHSKVVARANIEGGAMKNVRFGSRISNFSREQIESAVQNDFSDGFPFEFILIASHHISPRGEFFDFINILEQSGYERTTLFSCDGGLVERFLLRKQGEKA